jgi:hypothetical protein
VSSLPFPTADRSQASTTELRARAADVSGGGISPVIDAVVVDEPARVGRLRRGWRAARSAAEWVFGLASLIVGLAVVATVPVAQLLSFGYLLEVSGRIARTGKFTSGFIGVRRAARLGSIFLGAWVMLLPVRFVASLAGSARLIDPGGRTDTAWTIGLWTLTALIVAHIIGACWRGGRIRHFLWPAPVRVLKLLLRRGAYAEARDAVWDYVIGMRLPYFFWLGLRGLVGTLVWLVIPVALLAGATKTPALALVGGPLLAVVALYLPFVQARFAAENRMRALFEVREARKLFRRAPWAFWLGLLVTLALALPLYLLKIEIIPRDAAWMPSLLFVLFALPSRLVTGWACGLAGRRRGPRIWFSRHLARLAMLPVAAAYVFITYFTQYVSWYGLGSLYQQHAFLLPVPFLGQ